MNEVRDASRRLLRAMNDLQAKGEPYAIVGPSMEVVLRAELEPGSNLVTDAILLLLDENALIEDEDTDYINERRTGVSGTPENYNMAYKITEVGLSRAQ